MNEIQSITIKIYLSIYIFTNAYSIKIKIKKMLAHHKFPHAFQILFNIKNR